ncbi:MAG: hypothetical protein AAF892_01135 [Cyanobacteria bacterium P01_D01_bin.71]
MTPNGGNTTFLGNDIAADDDTFHSLIFFSTTAAPKMAAVAALLKEVAPQATPRRCMPGCGKPLWLWMIPARQGL